MKYTITHTDFEDNMRMITVHIERSDGKRERIRLARTNNGWEFYNRIVAETGDKTLYEEALYGPAYFDYFKNSVHSYDNQDSERLEETYRMIEAMEHHPKTRFYFLF